MPEIPNCVPTYTSMQGRRNGFEHGGDSKTPVTFEQFILQT